MRTLIASSSLVAVLFMASPTLAQTQNSQFCLKSSSSAQPSCIYQTMAQCEQAKGSNASAQCIPNPQGTTGLGGSNMGNGSPRTPSSPSR
jgi:hypothetical protein